MKAPLALSLFTGIGGFDVGLERAGFRCVGQAYGNAAAVPVVSWLAKRRQEHI